MFLIKPANTKWKLAQKPEMMQQFVVDKRRPVQLLNTNPNPNQ